MFTVNGKTYPLTGNPTLKQAAVNLDLWDDLTAIRLNGNFVPQQQWETCTIAAGDRLDMIVIASEG